MLFLDFGLASNQCWTMEMQDNMENLLLLTFIIENVS